MFGESNNAVCVNGVGAVALVKSLVKYGVELSAKSVPPTVYTGPWRGERVEGPSVSVCVCVCRYVSVCVCMYLPTHCVHRALERRAC